jgi:hypothetical protein
MDDRKPAALPAIPPTTVAIASHPHNRRVTKPNAMQSVSGQLESVAGTATAAVGCNTGVAAVMMELQQGLATQFRAANIGINAVVVRSCPQLC